jgi:hypothetical protein
MVGTKKRGLPLRQIGLWLALIGTGLLASASYASEPEPRFQQIAGTHVVGYQGWFACPSDSSQIGWAHWFRGQAGPHFDLQTDLWPDTSDFQPGDLCQTDLRTASGAKAYLFSSENPKVVDRHFAWMKQYGIDGVALERFATILTDERQLHHFDAVLSNVRAAAEKNGRGFFIMYDLTGVNAADVVSRLSDDWSHLQAMHLTTSPSYMHDRGMPIIALWGLGFSERSIDAATAAELIAFFKSKKFAVFGGVPSHWRTLDADAQSAPAWTAVYHSLDIISPWTVGRFSDESSVDAFVRDRVVPDMADAKSHSVEYVPVAFPGFSWHNLQNGKPPFNQISRACGSFYQRQVEDYLNAGATSLFTAMFDEVNEGTAIFKVESTNIPTAIPLTKPDIVPCKLTASDLYLKLAGTATSLVHKSAIK